MIVYRLSKVSGSQTPLAGSLKARKQCFGLFSLVVDKSTTASTGNCPSYGARSLLVATRLYKEYHEAYRDIMSADPASNTAWLPFAPRGAKAEDFAQYTSLRSTLQRGNDYYRRYRDLSIVLAIGIYGLSILDAYVDAELFTFDISPDLSMRVAPTLIPTNPMTGNMYQVGMGCQLTF